MSHVGDAPVWHDPHDDLVAVPVKRGRLKKFRESASEATIGGTVYQERLHQKIQKTNNPNSLSWVSKARKRRKRKLNKGDGEDESDSDDLDESGDNLDLKLRSSRALTKGHAGTKKGGKLLPGKIQIERKPNANRNDASSEVVSFVYFHPHEELLITAGRDRCFRVFQIDGEENPRKSSHFFNTHRIKDAAFTNDGQKVIIVGPKYIAEYDMETSSIQQVANVLGLEESQRVESATTSPHQELRDLFAIQCDSGRVRICDVRTKTSVRSVKMNAECGGVVFHPSEKCLITADKEANVYLWDISSSRCACTVKDVGALGITALAALPGKVNRPPMLATGSVTGVVNFWNLSAGPPSRFGNIPRPTTIAEVPNLVTSVSSIAVHQSCELVAASSFQMEDQLKLIHIPSYSVYSNFPRSTRLGRIGCVAFSERCGYMAFGDAIGRVNLYQVAHFA